MFNLKDNATFAGISVNKINQVSRTTLLKESISKYNSYSTEWEKAYFDEFSGGFNVHHKEHQFAKRAGGGEAEKIVGEMLAKYNGKQVEFLPEGVSKSPDFKFDNQTWDVKFVDNANENTIRTYIKDAKKANNAIFYWSGEKDKLVELRSAINREVGRMKKINRIDQMPDIYYINESGLLKLLWKK
ncbi:MAG: hypothetical protein LBU51_09420 [Bacteroidales bacterium]|nr:hypothetical protein [Bacteroidales bacterium]